jgi:hypothetical protein
VTAAIDEDTEAAAVDEDEEEVEEEVLFVGVPDGVLVPLDMPPI